MIEWALREGRGCTDGEHGLWIIPAVICFLSRRKCFAHGGSHCRCLAHISRHAKRVDCNVCMQCPQQLCSIQVQTPTFKSRYYCIWLQFSSFYACLDVLHSPRPVVMVLLCHSNDLWVFLGFQLIVSSGLFQLVCPILLAQLSTSALSTSALSCWYGTGRVCRRHLRCANAAVCRQWRVRFQRRPELWYLHHSWGNYCFSICCGFNLLLLGWPRSRQVCDVLPAKTDPKGVFPGWYRDLNIIPLQGV